MKRESEPLKVKAVVALDEKTIAQITPKDRGPDPIQKSIRGATWAAFYAVAAYAVVTTFMYCAMVHQNGLLRESITQSKTQWETQNRPWIGDGNIGFRQPPFFLVYPDNPEMARTQIDFDIQIPIKNVGLAPAFRVETELAGTMTRQIAAPENLNQMMETACHGADSNSEHIGQVFFPNSPETMFEQAHDVMVPYLKIIDVHRVWITVCTAYSSSGDAKLHHTKVWMASWPIDGRPTELRRSVNPNVIYYSLPIPNWGVIRTEAD